MPSPAMPPTTLTHYILQRTSEHWNRELFIGDSLFILNFFEIKQETIISHHLLNFNNSHSEAEFDEENPALDALESEIDELIYGPKDDFCF